MSPHFRLLRLRVDADPQSHQPHENRRLGVEILPRTGRGTPWPDASRTCPTHA